MLEEGSDQDLFTESFLSLGRVDHLTMVMALHPAYLSCFLKAQHALLELDGPLPRHWRHYIAVMVSGLKVVPFGPLGKITACLGRIQFIVFSFFVLIYWGRFVFLLGFFIVDPQVKKSTLEARC